MDCCKKNLRELSSLKTGAIVEIIGKKYLAQRLDPNKIIFVPEKKKNEKNSNMAF